MTGPEALRGLRQLARGTPLAVGVKELNRRCTAAMRAAPDLATAREAQQQVETLRLCWPADLDHLKARILLEAVRTALLELEAFGVWRKTKRTAMRSWP